MLLIVQTAPGVLEINYMWLPTFLGMNPIIIKDAQDDLAEKYMHQELSPETLKAIHEDLIEFFVDRHPRIHGLRAYLTALEHVAYDQEGHAPVPAD